LIYVLFLLTVTAVWGWTFVLIKDAVTQYPTLPFLQIRFALALVVMALVVIALVVIAPVIHRDLLVPVALVLAAILAHEGASLKFEGHGQPSPS
jgi:drug/metabolite transporter (DMT)-like permease